jgi:peroxiredoxin
MLADSIQKKTLFIHSIPIVMKTLAITVALLAGMLPLLNRSMPTGYGVGDAAEDFSLRNTEGQMVSLRDYKNVNGYIVVFTCNHCPYAQLYEQRIIDLHKKFAPKGYPVVAINPNSPEIVPEDSFEEMQKRAKAKHYPFQYLFDEYQKVYPLFGATRTPHVFILDTNRVVQYIGAIDDNPESPGSARHHFAESAIEALLRGEKPDPDFTRAIGCTVKKKP